ncbi:oligosaccharide translocation protein RFT1, variant [Coniochaeta sp. 2T2.1]|nr:oligosaccharide translocation protein RFT1, variant [Coniochaeta sp. 2T2.1]
MADPGSSRAVRGASLLILLQVGSRALTFTANQVLLRFMTASLLGVSAQLEVYYLSVLFFARESLRVAIQRQGNDDRGDIGKQDGKGSDGEKTTDATTTQAAVNISYLAIMLGVIVAIVLGYLYHSTVSQSSISATPYLSPSLFLYAFAAMVELLSEPAFVVMQIRLQFSVRATAEAVATFFRCFVTLGSAAWASFNGLELGVLPFALGQASYGVALLAVYIWYGLSLAQREKFSLLPVRLEEKSGSHQPAAKEKTANHQKPTSSTSTYALSYFPRPTLQLASSMMAQSLVKHVLTQGDTLLVSALSNPTAQGVYALANNYGGLVARLLFQPVEESCRNYFSRLLSSSSSSSSSSTTTPPSNNPDHQPSLPAIRKASADLVSLLKTYVLFSLLIISLGPTAAPLILSLVAGPKWAGSGAGECLSTFAYYVPLLAVNGVAEAFVASVATESQVHRQSAWMGAFSLVFALAGFVTLRVLDMGAVGLVVANCINMACRIVWCGVFIKRYFGSQGVEFEMQAMLPGPLAVAAGVVASGVVRRVVTGAAEVPLGPKQIIFQLAKVAAVTVPLLVAVAISERSFILQGYQAMRGKRTAQPAPPPP